MHAREVHAHEIPAYEMHARETPAYEIHAHETPAHETPAHQMHARGMHAHKVRFDFRKWGFVVLDAEPGLARMSVLAAAGMPKDTWAYEICQRDCALLQS